MKTFSYFLAAGMAVFLLSNFQLKVSKGNKQIVTREISITDYEKIEIAGNKIEIQYRQTPGSTGLTITTDKNILEMYRIEVTNGTLVIEPQKEFQQVIMRPSTFVVETHSSTLKKIELAGKNFFHINGPLTTESFHIESAGSSEIHSRSTLEAQKVSIEVAGNSKIYLPLLSAEKIITEQAGAGTIHLGGKADQLKVEIAGSTKVEALELETRHTSCEIAGNGKVTVTALENLKAEIAGIGKVRYRGNPKVKKEVAGIGSVKPFN